MAEQGCSSEVISGIGKNISGYLIEDSLERFILRDPDGPGLKGRSLPVET
jgi:hypothetical protein